MTSCFSSCVSGLFCVSESLLFCVLEVFSEFSEVSADSSACTTAKDETAETDETAEKAETTENEAVRNLDAFRET